MKRLSIILCALFLVFSMAGVAGAELFQYSDRALFLAEGSIRYYNDYENGDDGFSSQCNPWTSNGVTYTTGANVIVGTNTYLGPYSNVFTNNIWGGNVAATIETSPVSFDMFGLDLSYIVNESVSDYSLTFSVFTNVDTYEYSGINVPNANSPGSFWGFISDPGEHFTRFSISFQGDEVNPTIDNVTLGNTTPGNTNPVPEPATMLLLGAGLIGLAGFGRKKILKK